MNTKHIAFIVESAHGHVNPTLGTASELVKRGYHVSHAVTDYFAKRVTASGSKPFIYQQSDWKSKFFREMQADEGGEYLFDFSKNNRMSQMFELDRQAKSAAMDQVKILYREHKPDLLIVDCTTPAVRELASTWSVPLVEYFPMLIDDTTFEYFSDLVIVTLPKFFQKDADKLAHSFHFVGPVFHNGQFFRPWNSGDQKQRVILVSATTGLLPDVEFFASAIQAFSALPYRTVLSIGDEIDPSILGPLPDNCEVNQFSSQLDILSQACLFVGQGGTSSTMEALRCGVPLLLLPPSQMQDSNARRIAELGLGIRLQKHEFSIENLRNSAMTLLGSAEILERVKEAQAIIKASNGATAAADLIEGFMKKTGIL